MPQMPEPVQPPEYIVEGNEEYEEVEEKPEMLDEDDREDLDGLTRLDEKDMNHYFGTKGTLDVNEEDDDLSDLVDVDIKKDIIGEKPKPKKKYRIIPRRRYIRPPSSFGGVQY